MLECARSLPHTRAHLPSPPRQNSSSGAVAVSPTVRLVPRSGHRLATPRPRGTRASMSRTALATALRRARRRLSRAALVIEVPGHVGKIPWELRHFFQELGQWAKGLHAARGCRWWGVQSFVKRASKFLQRFERQPIQHCKQRLKARTSAVVMPAHSVRRHRLETQGVWRSASFRISV
jgi:hypothetical protein